MGTEISPDAERAGMLAALHAITVGVLSTLKRKGLLTGQELDAAEAKELGVVNEVLAPDALAARARQLAEEIASKPFLTRRYTRLALVQPWKQMMVDGLGYGLAIEALAAVDEWPEDGGMAK